MSRNLIAWMDLTRLELDDAPSTIAALCEKALTQGPVAAVCVYPAYIAQVQAHLQGSPIAVATVANFPSGQAPTATVVAEILDSCAQGAQEIDVVIPYQAFIEQPDPAALTAFVATCRAACPQQCLKVILESGAFPTLPLLESAARAVIAGGADFLKTSTGKIALGATPAAVATLVAVIVAHQAKTGVRIGLKVSGGVRTIAQALGYSASLQAAFPQQPLSATHFRIGASALLDAVLEENISNIAL